MFFLLCVRWVRTDGKLLHSEHRSWRRQYRIFYLSAACLETGSILRLEVHYFQKPG